jgi:transitional endoplasmic reticulum ATPase
MSSWQPKGLPAIGLKGALWAAVGAVLLLSYVLYTPPQASSGSEGATDWIFQSWPALFAATLAMWLLLRGPVATAHTLIQKACRLAMFFFAYCGFLYILKWDPFWRLIRGLGFESHNKTEGFLILVSTLIWLGVSLRVLFAFRFPVSGLGFGIPVLTKNRAPEMKTTRPTVTYADVGGMEDAKQQIREIVENRLNSANFNKYGVVRNGILLYGPRGSGKTRLAEATAGEFKLNYTYLSPTAVSNMWMGSTGSNLRAVFVDAASRRPGILFIDEIDSIGSQRQTLESGGDPGGGGRERNNVVLQLMQSLDHYRDMLGLIFMAATNVLDALDPALIRDGRFDVHIRIDLPDEKTRQKIFEALLKQKPAHAFDLANLARRTPGYSAAKIKGLVDKAATSAARTNRRIEEIDLITALDESGGKDRPLVQPVQWEDLIVEPDVEQELRTLIRQLNADWSRTTDLIALTGVLLVGPPGTGKTMIGRLIATQTKRSFYPLSAAEILGGQVGASVKKLAEIFTRARENSPSIIFFDEMDGLLPVNNGMLSTHDAQLVEQCRIEISQLEAAHNVLLVGTTNHLERIDPAILRGGRFSEKIEITLPGPVNRERLLRKYLQGLTTSLDLAALAERLGPISPADIEAVCKSAARRAFGRGNSDDCVPPLVADDFDHAIKRVVIHSS